MTEYRKVRVKGKTYVTPLYEEDLVIDDYDSIDVFDYTSSRSWSMQKHKNKAKTISNTVTF